MSSQGFDEGLNFLMKKGFPTFDEFRKDPDKYRQKAEEIFESADGSTIGLRNRLKKQKYSWKDTFKVDSLEKIDRIAKEEGYSPFDLEMEPIVEAKGGELSDIEITVRFWPKEELKARGGIIANA